MKVYQVMCDGEQIGGIFASDAAARQFISEDLLSHCEGANRLGIKPYLDIASYEVFESELIGYKGVDVDKILKDALAAMGVILPPVDTKEIK